MLKRHLGGWMRRREAVRVAREMRRVRAAAGDSIVGVSGGYIGAVVAFTAVA